MRIKFLSTVAVAVAALAVGTASASATTITKDSDGLAVGTNFALSATNSGSVSLGASWGTITCNSSSMGMNIDTDGSVDVGDVTSASFGNPGCSASFGTNACVYPDNIGSSSGAITYNAGTDPVHDMAVNATRNTIVINPVNSSCPASPRTTHQSSGCTIVVAGNLNGTFNENTNVATLSNAPGLQVVSKSGTGFLCFSINTGTAATFNGSYTVSPGISVGP